MSGADENIRPLILDFLEWVAAEPRPYAEAMDAWRTSRPRLTVWEDSVDRDLVRRRRDMRLGPLVEATAGGLALLARENRTLPKARQPASLLVAAQ